MQGYSLMPALTGVGTLTRPAAPLPELQNVLGAICVCVVCVCAQFVSGLVYFKMYEIPWNAYAFLTFFVCSESLNLT